MAQLRLKYMRLNHKTNLLAISKCLFGKDGHILPSRLPVR